MTKSEDKVILAIVGVVCIFMFMLGRYTGMEEAHKLMHARFTEMCPTHEISHTVSGKHLCYLDAISVRKMD